MHVLFWTLQLPWKLGSGWLLLLLVFRSHWYVLAQHQLVSVALCFFPFSPKSIFCLWSLWQTPALKLFLPHRLSKACLAIFLGQVWVKCGSLNGARLQLPIYFVCQRLCWNGCSPLAREGPPSAFFLLDKDYFPLSPGKFPNLLKIINMCHQGNSDPFQGFPGREVVDHSLLLRAP